MTKRHVIEPGFPLGRLLAGYPRIGRLILAAAVCFGLSVSAIAQKKPALLVPDTAVMKSPTGKTLQVAQVTVTREAGKSTGTMMISINVDGADKDTGFQNGQQFDSLDISFFAKKGTKWDLCGNHSLTGVLVGTVHYFAGHFGKQKDVVVVAFRYQKIAWTHSSGGQKPKDNWLAAGG